MPFKAAALRGAFRLYPFQKGRYRLMTFFERILERRDGVGAAFGPCKLVLDLREDSLDRTFYHFMPERYEHETQRYIRETVKEGMTVIDVGAHHGLFTLLLASCVGKSGKVYAIEPEEANFFKLKRNVEANGFTQVVPMRLALADFCGQTQLVLSSANANHFLRGAVVNGAGQAQHAQNVAVETLDTLFKKLHLKKIDFIKIDAEASELLILRGAKDVLSQGAAPRIACEVHSSWKKSEVGGDAVRKTFYSYGYRSYVLNAKLSKKPYLSELKPEEPVAGLQNLLFLKQL